MNHHRIKILPIITVILICLSCTAISAEFRIVPQDVVQEVIPLTLTNGFPIVDVRIENNVFKLILDTGADSATIRLTPTALKKIQVDVLDRKMRLLDTNGKSYEENQFQIPVLHIERLEFTNLIAREELRQFKVFEFADGVIGNQILNQFNILIDYKGSRLVLFSKAIYPDDLRLENWTKLNFEHNKIGIILNGSIDEKNFKFCLDTGMVAIRNRRSYGKLKYDAWPKPIDNKPVATKHFKVDGVDLGPMDFYVRKFEQPPVDGFLGYNFFSKFQTFIDFEPKVMYVKKY